MFRLNGKKILPSQNFEQLQVTRPRVLNVIRRPVRGIIVEAFPGLQNASVQVYGEPAHAVSVLSCLVWKIAAREFLRGANLGMFARKADPIRSSSNDHGL